MRKAIFAHLDAGGAGLILTFDVQLRCRGKM